MGFKHFLPIKLSMKLQR